MKKVILKSPNLDNPHFKAYSRAVKNGFKTLHVSPLKDGWVVRKVESSGSSKIFVNKEDAIKFGTKVAKNKKTELIIHGRDGRIRERNSYVRDSYPPRGR